MEAKVRVVLRIHPFLLCSAVQLFLAENRRLDVVVADENLDAPEAETAEQTVQVVLREGWLNFEVCRAEEKDYCQDLATLAGKLNGIAANSPAGSAGRTRTE